MVTLLVIYILLSASAAYWASERGRNFWTVFFISITITPLVVIASMWNQFQKSPLLKK
jgi:ABC-type sugar transport system permease subunit